MAKARARKKTPKKKKVMSAEKAYDELSIDRVTDDLLCQLAGEDAYVSARALMNALGDTFLDHFTLEEATNYLSILTNALQRTYGST